MKKGLYITLFTFLGALVSLIIHGIIETLVLNYVVANYDKYALSSIVTNWHQIHRIGSLILSVAGVGLGTILGFRYWRILYVEKRHGELWL